MPLKIKNKQITLSKARLPKAYANLFEKILSVDKGKPVTEIELSEAVEKTSGKNLLTITGLSKHRIWNAEKTEVTLTYKTENTKIFFLQIELKKPVNTFSLLKDLFEVLNISDPFEKLHLRLLTVATLEGKGSMGIMTMELEGLLNLGKGVILPWKILHPENIRYKDSAGSNNHYPFTLEVYFNQTHPAPKLSQLASLFGNETAPHKDLEDWLPGDLKERPVSLSDLRLTFDLKDTYKLIEIETKLSILEGHMWEIVPGFISAGGLWIDLVVQNPLNADYRFPTVEVGGTIQLGEDPRNGNVLLKARWPDYSISGQLVDGQSIEVGAILNHFHLLGTGDSGLDKMAISQLSFFAEPLPVEGQAKTFNFHLVVDDVWTLKHNQKPLFEIHQLRLLLNYSSAEREGLSATFEGRFILTLQLEGKEEPIDFALSAAYGKSLGWQFIGNAVTEGRKIPVGILLEHLIQKFKKVDNYKLPEAIHSAVLKNLHVSFNSKTKDFNFSIETVMLVQKGEKPEGDKILDLTVTVDFKKEGENYIKQINGKILIAGLEFDLTFNQTGQAKAFLGAYKNQGGGKIPLSQLIESVTDIEGLPDIEIDLKEALFFYFKDAVDPKATAKVLFHIAVNTSVSISQLPLVGKYFSQENSLGLLFSVLAGTKDFLNDANAKEQLLGLPGGKSVQLPSEKKELPDLQVAINLGGKIIEADLPKMVITSAQNTSNTDPSTNVDPNLGVTLADPTIDNSSIMWLSLQKSFGPVTVQQLGIQYVNKKIALLLQASLEAGPLSISLDGLGVRTPLKPIQPEFFLNGMGVMFKTGPLEIGGAFLRNPSPPKGTRFEYAGAAVLKIKTLSIGALGSYAEFDDGHPSLFLYGVLDFPIGGPAFFFVTGLAAGFGYNRSLRMPNIREVASFPLVEQVVKGTATNASTAADLTKELDKLSGWIPPASGEYFLAAGIRFSSFKIIDSFVLVSVSFGIHLELNILGLSTLVMPPNIEGQKEVPPIAEVQLALKASFNPEEGFLGIEAQLTNNSFILSKDCHLTGGFAFYSWFAGIHKGDFVVSIGGYHKNFRVPANYPVVPRVGFNWQIKENLSIKGGMYFALVPSAVMAGGAMEFLWQNASGRIKAWFIAGIDFLLSWKPYFYDAKVSINVGVSYTFSVYGKKRLKGQVGAELNLWGPDFSGKARIRFRSISFTISFGANARKRPKAIEWKEFQDSFLPTPEDILTVNVEKGLIRKLRKDKKKSAPSGESNLAAINPKEFQIGINSAIPLTIDKYNTEITPPSIGIAPMGLSNFTSYFTLKFKVNGIAKSVGYFEIEPITKEVPVALWGKSISPNLNGKRIVKDVPVGYRIKAKPPGNPNKISVLDRKNLLIQWEDWKGKNGKKWKANRKFASIDKDRVKATIGQDQQFQNRNKILSDFGLKEEVDLDLELVDALVI